MSPGLLSVTSLIALGIVIYGLKRLDQYFKTRLKSTVEESVKHQFQLERDGLRQDFEKEMSGVEWKRNIRLAALEKRLEVHQKAFGLALTVVSNMFAEGQTRMNIQRSLNEFWENQSLYLTNEARRAFKKGIDFYSNHMVLVEAHRRNPSDDYYSQLDERWNYFFALPGIIAKEVDLEAMEQQTLSNDNEQMTPTGLTHDKGKKRND